jgi:hypothetical protein
MFGFRKKKDLITEELIKYGDCGDLTTIRNNVDVNEFSTL